MAKELIDAGIFTNTKQVAPEVWTGKINTSRVFNNDETPQFINYGVDGTPNGLVYAGRGESCKRMINENRECVTINPWFLCQGLFAFAKLFLAQQASQITWLQKQSLRRLTTY